MQDDAEQRQPTRAPRDGEGHDLAATTGFSRFGETKSDEIARYEKQGHSPEEQQERAHRYRSSLSAEPHSRGRRIMDSPTDACGRRRCCRNPKSERRAPFSDGLSATASKGRRAAPTRDKARVCWEPRTEGSRSRPLPPAPQHPRIAPHVWQVAPPHIAACGKSPGSGRL